MSRDLGCCDLLQAGLASPHPSPLEGSSVASLTGGTLYITLQGEHPHQDHSGDACAAGKPESCRRYTKSGRDECYGKCTGD